MAPPHQPNKVTSQANRKGKAQTPLHKLTRASTSKISQTIAGGAVNSKVFPLGKGRGFKQTPRNMKNQLTSNKSKAATNAHSQPGSSGTSKKPNKNMLELLPWDVLEHIFKLAFDPDSSVIYAMVQFPRPSFRPNPHPSQIGALQAPQEQIGLVPLKGFVDHSHWKWAHNLANTFPHLRDVADRQIATKAVCLANPLAPVRRETDLVVYYFPRAIHNWSWHWAIDKQHSHGVLGPGVQNVGIPLDNKHCGGLRCYCGVSARAGEREPGHKNYGGDVLCPVEVAEFVDHFADVRNVFFLLTLQCKDMRDTRFRSVKKIKQHVRELISKAQKTPDLALFEDAGRQWVEPGKKDQGGFINSDAWHAAKASKANFLRLWNPAMPEAKRRQVKFRVLVSSYWKNIGE